MDVGRSTVSETLKNKDRWLSGNSNVNMKSGASREKAPKHVQLEEALYAWFLNARQQGAAVTDQLLCVKAKKFGAAFGVSDDFKYSHGWICRFKKRRNILMVPLHGEALSADLEGIDHGREVCHQVLKNYDLSCVYNMDESAIYYNTDPNKSLDIIKNPSGKKKIKTRITVALCVNADGSDKQKPIVINKAYKPQVFGKRFDPQRLVHWYANKKAWMTTGLFNNWIIKFNSDIKLKNKKVILLLDNASSHVKEEMTTLSNVVLHFLPPNTTSRIQPLDAGIIRTFKAHYRAKQLQQYVDQLDNNEPMLISVREALHHIVDAWKEVKTSTITNCWRHTQILPLPVATPVGDGVAKPTRNIFDVLQQPLPVDAHATVGADIDEAARNVFNRLQQLNIQNINDELVNNMIDLEADETEQKLTDEDIIIMTDTGEGEQVAEEVDVQGEIEVDQVELLPVANKAAIDAILTLQQYADENEFMEEYGLAISDIKNNIESNLQKQKKQIKIDSFF